LVEPSGRAAGLLKAAGLVPVKSNAMEEWRKVDEVPGLIEALP
jgi:hypothetical protein